MHKLIRVSENNFDKIASTIISLMHNGELVKINSKSYKIKRTKSRVTLQNIDKPKERYSAKFTDYGLLGNDRWQHLIREIESDVGTDLVNRCNPLYDISECGRIFEERWLSNE